MRPPETSTSQFSTAFAIHYGQWQDLCSIVVMEYSTKPKGSPMISGFSICSKGTENASITLACGSLEVVPRRFPDYQSPDQTPQTRSHSSELRAEARDHEQYSSTKTHALACYDRIAKKDNTRGLVTLRVRKRRIECHTRKSLLRKRRNQNHIAVERHV